MSRFIPALSSTDPKDTGARYMVARHRFLISEKVLKMPIKELRRSYPGKNDQEMMLVAAKATDIDEYNKWFDFFVRNIEPETTIIQTQVVIPDDVKEILLTQARAIEYDARERIIKKSEEEKEKLTEIAASIAAQSKNFEKHLGEYLRNKIDEESKKFNTVEFVVKTPSGKKIKIEDPIPEQFEDVCDLVSNRVNVLLVGPSGCGKTHLSYMVAKALDMDFSAQSCSSGMSESAFAGWLLPIEKSGRFVYVQSEFVRIYENGGLFLFDEIDAADSNTLLFLNQALANDRFYLPHRYDNPCVLRSPDFAAIAAANTYGNGATALYSGRNSMDAATMDRFRAGVIAMDYSSEIEEKLVDKDVLAWGRVVRKVIQAKSLRKIMSTRFLIDATKMKNNGSAWGFDKISQTYFSDWSREDKKMIFEDQDYRKYLAPPKVDNANLTQDQQRAVMMTMKERLMGRGF